MDDATAPGDNGWKTTDPVVNMIEESRSQYWYARIFTILVWARQHSDDQRFQRGMGACDVTNPVFPG